MDIEEVKAFLESDEGSTLLNEYKAPIVGKRDELQGKLIDAKAEVARLQGAADSQTAAVEAAANEQTKTDLQKKGDFDAYKAFHETEVNKFKDELSNMKSKYAGTEVSRMITEVASKNSTSPKPLQLLLRERVSASYAEDGKLEVQVKDDSGQPMYFDGQPATINHLVESLKSNEEYGAFFSASGASGAGTNQSDGDAATAGDYKDMSSDNFNLTKSMGNK